jgi:hypothetical protein
MLVQDLHLINEAVVPLHPVVPNPYMAEWQYPQATLLQYVDDLLLCGPIKAVISRSTES